jgi:hypothetical protein
MRTVRRNIFPPSSGSTIKYSTEQVNFYQPTRRHIPEDNRIQTSCFHYRQGNKREQNYLNEYDLVPHTRFGPISPNIIRLVVLRHDASLEAYT